MKKIYLMTLLSLLFINCSNNVDNITLPSVDSISTNKANVGDVITIIGKNFNPNETYIIEFNDLKGIITEINKNYIKVKIPEKSISGNIYIKYSEGTISVGNIIIENIFLGNIKLITQNEIDEFGSNNYTQIIGNIEIGDFNEFNESINSIEKLKYLNNIVGHFYILNLTSLDNLKGLERLTRVDLDFRIQDMHGIVSLNRLESLVEVGGSFILQNNDALQNLNGLSKLTKVDEHFIIFTNDNLSDIEGLIGLKSITGDFSISYNKLTNLSGLDNLESIKGALSIYRETKLTELFGLTALSSIGVLEISKNGILTDFCSLQGLLSNNGLKADYIVSENLYNPKIQDIIDGNCSL